MPAYVEPALVALSNIFSWPGILFLFLGTLLGFVFGAIPGLGGLVAISLLLPLISRLSQSLAMLFIVSALGGVAFGGALSSILIKVPGTPMNTVTMFDGYPLTREGRSGEAIGIAAMASASGAVLGAVVFMALIPVAREIVFALGVPEFFWLTIFALTIIGTITTGNLLKGLASGLFGMLIAFVGFTGITGAYRFGFRDALSLQRDPSRPCARGPLCPWGSTQFEREGRCNHG